VPATDDSPRRSRSTPRHDPLRTCPTCQLLVFAKALDPGLSVSPPTIEIERPEGVTPGPVAFVSRDVPQTQLARPPPTAG
jgi:hypothetical protein